MSGFYPFLRFWFARLVKVWYVDIHMAFISEMQPGKRLESVWVIMMVDSPTIVLVMWPESNRDWRKCAGSFMIEVLLLLIKEMRRDSFCHFSGCCHFWGSHMVYQSHPAGGLGDRRVEEWKIWSPRWLDYAADWSRPGLCLALNFQ